MGPANPTAPLGPSPVLQHPSATCVPNVPWVAEADLGQPGLNRGAAGPSSTTPGGTHTRDSSITGRLPRQSEMAPVSGAERNCRTEKTEPIRPEGDRVMVTTPQSPRVWSHWPSTPRPWTSGQGGPDKVDTQGADCALE